MASTTQTARRNAARTTAQGAAEQARALTREAGQDAQEALGRSIKISVDTMTNLSEIGQQVSRHLMDLTLASTQEAFRLWPALFSSVLDGVRSNADHFPMNADAVNVWQRVLDGGTDAFSQYTKTVQHASEEGTERINQAMSSLADRVHENSREVGEVADKIEQNRAGRSDNRTGPASANSN